MELLERDGPVSLHARGVVSVPDFIANAGGVICAAVEYRGRRHRGAGVRGDRGQGSRGHRR